MKVTPFVITILLSLSLSAVEASALTIDTGPKTDTLFVGSEGSVEDVRTMANLFSASAAYGIWSNKVLNGSGNKSLLEKNPQPEGYFSQLLRTLSLYDLYFTSGVLRMQSTMKSGQKASITIAGGSLSRDFVAKQPEPKLDFLGKGVAMGFVDLGPFAQFAVREMPSKSMSYVKGEAKFPPSIFRKEFNQGLANRYWDLKVKAARSGLSERLMAINALYWPLGFVGTLHVEPKQMRSSKASYLLLMPGPGELKTPDKRNPNTWTVETIEKKSDKALETEFATVNTVVYDGAGRDQRNNLSLMRIETQKDFNRPRELDIVLSFGHQAGSDKQELTGLSYRFTNEALRMRGFLRMRKLEESSFAGWKAVKKITDYFRQFKVEVGFHKLGLTMVRPNIPGNAKKVFEANPTFSLRYNPKNSLLSYRIFKYVQADEAKTLSKIGFTCKDAEGGKKYCDRLFWSAKELAHGFFNDFNKGVLNQIFAKILGKVTKDAFKEELPEVKSEVNEALAGVVLKMIEDGQKAKAMTSKLLPGGPMDAAKLLMMNQ